MREESATPRDVEVARIAKGQHGVVSVAQLRAAGLDKSAVARRVRAGRLHRVHQGVYAVGHAALGWEARWMAAALACGDGAVVSHMSAAALWGFLRPVDAPVDVSVPSAAGRRHRSGIRVHRCASLASRGVAQRGVAQNSRYARGKRHAPLVTERDGIPVTTAQRTIEDLRRSAVPERLIRRATRQAELAGWRVGRVPARTRSDLEDDFLALCRRHRVRLPETDVRIGRWTVDFLWPEARLVVETDAWSTHRGSVAFEDDHARDLDLRRCGYTVRRYTEAQIHDSPALVVADLREVLGAAA